MATSKAASVIKVDHLLGVLQRRSKSLGVNLVWDNYKGVPKTNGSTISLPMPRHPITEEDMVKLYGYVIHECGHNTRLDAFKIAAASGCNDTMLMIYNLVEDDGMEREVGGRYIGDGKALGKKNVLSIRDLSKAWSAAEHEWADDLDEQQLAPMAGAALSQLSRMDWDSESTVSIDEFVDSLHPVAKKLLGDLGSEGWIEKLQGTSNPHDTWDVACDLYKRLYPNSDDEETEKSRELGHAMGGTLAKEQIQKQEQGQAQAGDKGKDDGEDGKGPNKPSEGKVVSWRDAVLSEHGIYKKKEPGQLAGNIGIDWKDFTEGEVGFMPPNLINVVDMSKHNKNKKGGGYGPSTESLMPDNTQARAFGARIRRYIQAKARTKVTVDKYHGKINKGAMIKLALPPIDGGDWNKKLFYEMSEAKALDTCILVLTDWSGSMGGHKMVYAADASSRLVHVFDKVLRIPVCLAAFTNGETECDIGLIKPFNMRAVTAKEIAEGFSAFYWYTSANNDADAVLWAHRQLLKRKESRKILIVLSDGAPAGCWIGSGHSNLLRATHDIEKAGLVELYGVGICSTAVQNYYTNYKVIHKPSDINNVLFNIIKEGVKR